MKLDSIFWAGTEQALASFISGEKKAENMPVNKEAYSSSDSVDTQDVPRLFNLMGNVGVISIAGPLVNNDSWINAYLGRTGYGEIRDALVHAATNPDVGAIVLDINSGGGAVSGVSDTAALIKKIDKEMKPVHTFSDGMIASAAYWLGSSARSVSLGSVTEAGSIGVITVHQEYSKQLEANGVKATVIKAGEHKGTGNPYEPLTDKAKAEIQGQIDHMYGLFVQGVADNRGATYQAVDSKMAQGRVFIGSQAVDVGLADAVSTFDAVVSKVQGAIDSKKNSAQYGANFSKGPAMKVALTEQQIALMAEGGVLSPVAEAVAAVAAEAIENAAAPAAEVVEPKAEAPAAEAAPEAKPESPDLVAFLKSSLAEAQASVMDLTIQLRDAKASGEKIEASHGALRSIAVASVDRLKVALGGSAGGADALSDETLLAEHASLRAQFEGKFKAGGVAAVSTEATPDPKSNAVDPVRAARLASTRLAK